MKILITGVAGFIGFHVTKKLLERGDKIIGIDNLNSYYSVKLKKARLKLLIKTSKISKGSFLFLKKDINNRKAVQKCFQKYKFDRVIHLAAQAGVRYSLINPRRYIDTNIKGFFNILDESKNNKVPHFVYASTSSIYGANKTLPFKETHTTDHPIQIYAVTKKTNELMAHAYSSLYFLPTTGLRFFTVYGPWGRPDMALFNFVKNILSGKSIDIYNYGKHSRDFTFIDDIVEGAIKASDKICKANKNWNNKQPELGSSKVPFQVLNIGNGKRVKLLQFIKAIEKFTSKKAIIKNLPLQPGDIEDTFSNTQKIKKNYNYKPKTNIEDGVKLFVKWYKEFYGK